MSLMDINNTLTKDNDFSINGTVFTDITTPWSEGTTERPYWMGVLDQATAIIMTVNLITLMFGMGAATYLTEVWRNIKRPWGSMIGMLCQFGFLPATAFGISILLDLPPYQALGVLILSCSPGGAFSNFFTYWVDGDIALSILMTSTSSLLAFGGMPLNLWIYTKHWTEDEMRIPYINVLKSMCFVTGPAIVGMVMRHYTRLWANRLSKLCGILGWVGALTCGTFIILIYWDTIITVSINVLIAAAILPVLGFVFSYVISKILCMSHKVCRTIGIETGCQNVVVAINVILLSYQSAEIRGQMVIFPTIYAVFQLSEIFLAIILFQIYKFIHRNDVTEEEVKSVIDTSILTRVPVPVQTNFRKPANVDNDPDIVSTYNTRIVIDRNSTAGISLQQRFDETYPFITVDAHDNIENMARQLNVVPCNEADIVRVGGPPSTTERRRQSQNRPSDREHSLEYAEVKSDEERIPYEIAGTLPIGTSYPTSSSLYCEIADIIPPPMTYADRFRFEELPATPRSPSLNAGYEFRTFGASGKRH